LGRKKLVIQPTLLPNFQVLNLQLIQTRVDYLLPVWRLNLINTWVEISISILPIGVPLVFKSV